MSKRNKPIKAMIWIFNLYSILLFYSVYCYINIIHTCTSYISFTFIPEVIHFDFIAWFLVSNKIHKQNTNRKTSGYYIPRSNTCSLISISITISLTTSNGRSGEAGTGWHWRVGRTDVACPWSPEACPPGPGFGYFACSSCCGPL